MILAIWVASAGLLVFLAGLSVPHNIQFMTTTSTLGVMAVLLFLSNRRSNRDTLMEGLRLTVLILAGFLTLRYLSWRIGYTIRFHDLPSLIGALVLLGAEIYGTMMYFLGAVVNCSPRHRDIPELDEDNLPTVDVLIPTYNEEEEILEVTLLAATQLDYPSDRLTVWLLDDGGTLAKRQDPDPEAARIATMRHHRLWALCERLGARYLTRTDNKDAKAGNINAALLETTGDLVLALDADHVPSSDILRNTVGFFQADPKLFLVQTPHRFITPDPVEKNLGVTGKMPGESEIFYRQVQHGLDAWDSAFFCGSAAVLRRSCLDEIGGISGESVTEDAETSLKLHSRGYRSVYVGKPMVFGLQPETFEKFIGQRSRWAQGMVQIFLRLNPLKQKGLSPGQRLGYLNSTMFWFFSYARLIFLLAPCAYLLFGLKIYDASLDQFLLYAAPHLIGALIAANLLFGRSRWAFVSELYESVQAFHSSAAISRAIANPDAPEFKVTDKGGEVSDEFISPLAKPFIIVFVLLSAALIAAFWRYLHSPIEKEVVFITAGWAVFNLIVILGGLGALLERRQLRKAPRMRLRPPVDAVLKLDDSSVHCRLLDISMGGSAITLPGGGYRKLNPGAVGELRVANGARGRVARLPVRIVRVNEKNTTVSLAFERMSPACKRHIVALGFGNSDNLRWGVERDEATVGIIRGIAAFVSISIRHGVRLLSFALTNGWRNLNDAFAIRQSIDQEKSMNKKDPGGEHQTTQDKERKSMSTSYRTAGIAILVISGLALATAPSVAPAQELVGQPPSEASVDQASIALLEQQVVEKTDMLLDVMNAEITLAELMAEQDSVTLRSAADQYVFSLPVPPRIKVEKATLELIYTNSISLLEKRSQLRVQLNGKVLAQVALRPLHPEGLLRVNLPARLMEPGYNRLSFHVAQHYVEQCEDSTASELWTQIDPVNSKLNITYTLRDIEDSLASLTDLVGPLGWNPYRLSVFTAGDDLDTGLLRNGALISSGIASLLDYRPLKVTHSVAAVSDYPALMATGRETRVDNETGDDAVLVGTRDELAPWLSDTVREEIQGAYLGLTRNASQPDRFVLIVSGRNADEVERAAMAFAVGGRDLPPVGSMIISNVIEPSLSTYSHAGAIESDKRYPLSTFGFNTTTVGGPNGDENQFELWVPPDLFAPADSMVELHLHLAYGAGGGPTSVINVSLNDRFASAIRLASPDGGVYRDYVIRLPATWLSAGRNVVKFNAHLTPLSTGDVCFAPSDTALLATLFDDSWLTLSEVAHQVELPNLSLLATTGYPYVSPPDGSAMHIRLSSPDSETVSAAWTVIGKLTQLGGVGPWHATIGTDEAPADRHEWVIGNYASLPVDIVEKAPISSGPEGRLRPVVMNLPTGQQDLRAVRSWFPSGRGLAQSSPPESSLASIGYEAGPDERSFMMQFESPRHPGKSVTVLTAASSLGLLAATEHLVGHELWGSLAGDVTSWTPASKTVSVARISKSFRIGESDIRSRASHYFTGRPGLWNGLLATAVLLFVLTSIWLLRRRRRQAV